MNDEQSCAAERITDVVASWPEVDIGPHRFGGVEFRLGRRELGHLHGNRIADLPFPRRVRDELIAAGRARPHHVLPDSSDRCGVATHRGGWSPLVPGIASRFSQASDKRTLEPKASTASQRLRGGIDELSAGKWYAGVWVTLAASFPSWRSIAVSSTISVRPRVLSTPPRARGRTLCGRSQEPANLYRTRLGGGH